MASMETGASRLQLQTIKFCQQPECAGKWILPQTLKIRAQPLLCQHHDFALVRPLARNLV